MKTEEIYPLIHRDFWKFYDFVEHDEVEFGLQLYKEDLLEQHLLFKLFVSKRLYFLSNGFRDKDGRGSSIIHILVRAGLHLECERQIVVNNFTWLQYAAACFELGRHPEIEPEKPIDLFLLSWAFELEAGLLESVFPVAPVADSPIFPQRMAALASYTSR